MKKYISVSESVDVDIDVDITDYIDDFLAACSDDDLIEEVVKRRLNPGGTPNLTVNNDFRRFLCDILGFASRWVRFCCSELKEYKILDNAIQGIRRCESIRRRDRYKEPTMCRFYGSKKNHVNVILPILEWTDDDVAAFINANGIRCHPLYYDDQGCFHVERRLGCIGCPLQNDRGVSELKKHPLMVREYIKRTKIWRETHPNAKTHLKFTDEYETFMMSKFFDSYEDFRLATTGMFGDIDCKAWLEEYFNVEL